MPHFRILTDLSYPDKLLKAGTVVTEADFPGPIPYSALEVVTPKPSKSL